YSVLRTIPSSAAAATLLPLCFSSTFMMCSISISFSVRGAGGPALGAAGAGRGGSGHVGGPPARGILARPGLRRVFFPPRQDPRVLHDVGQLADVARPLVLEQRIDRFRRQQVGDLLHRALGGPGEQVPG